MRAGEQLREIRARLGITGRQVEDASKRIAAAEGNPEFEISHARLAQIEGGESTPGLYRLFSLIAIYGIKVSEMLGLYVDAGMLGRHRVERGGERTHLLEAGFDETRASELPALLRLAGEASGETELHWRKLRYAEIGWEDRTLDPIVRPGSLVLIDESQRRVEMSGWTNAYDRPIYFVEIRGGYLWGWCEKTGHELTVVPHPGSGYPLRRFLWPQEAEIVGRVVAVAAMLGGPGKARGKKAMAAAVSK